MVFCLLLFVSSVLLSSCWSKKELIDLAIVAAIGIDKGENKEFKGTFQIFNPVNTAGGLQGGNAGEGTSVQVYTTEGDSLVDVSRRISNKLSRSVYYSHASLVVIGSELAEEEGILRIMDALDRDVEFRDTSKIVLAHEGSAEDLLKVLTPIDKIPAEKIVKTMEASEERWGEQMEVNLQEAISTLINPGKELMLPVFKIDGSAQEGKESGNIQSSIPKTIIVANGLAIFKEGKMISWLQGDKAKGALWVLDKINATNIEIDWEEENSVISFQVDKSQSKIKLEMVNGQPQFIIKVNFRGSIGEVEIPLDITEQEVVNKIEKKVENKVEQIINNVIEDAQEKKTDIFGLGSELHYSHPEEWKKVKKNWNNDYFPELDIKVVVNADVVRTGLRGNPFWLQLQENNK